MSETVHYTGKLTKVETGNDINLAASIKRMLGSFGCEIEDHCDPDAQYDSLIEQFEDEFYKDFVIIDEVIYRVEMKENDPDGDIMKASKKEDGTIEFELRYYNGGCSFDEAINEAIDGIS